ncbi:unnamed protein product, partial [Ectocarpus sp. 4 AP-2014]
VCPVINANFFCTNAFSTASGTDYVVVGVGPRDELSHVRTCLRSAGCGSIRGQIPHNHGHEERLRWFANMVDNVSASSQQRCKSHVTRYTHMEVGSYLASIGMTLE